jgi:uncharacterized membrane protein
LEGGWKAIGDHSDTAPSLACLCVLLAIIEHGVAPHPRSAFNQHREKSYIRGGMKMFSLFIVIVAAIVVGYSIVAALNRPTIPPTFWPISKAERVFTGFLMVLFCLMILAALRSPLLG